MAHEEGANAPQGAALLRQEDIRRMLGGISERTFHELRAAGIIPAPLELRPRVPRWTQEDYRQIVECLPRRQKTAEPTNLAEGRRARIMNMKAPAREAA